jgi:hypothetical protein
MMLTQTDGSRVGFDEMRSTKSVTARMAASLRYPCKSRLATGEFGVLICADREYLYMVASH